jgi:hypothetical protein
MLCIWNILLQCYSYAAIFRKYSPLLYVKLDLQCIYITLRCNILVMQGDTDSPNIYMLLYEIFYCNVIITLQYFLYILLWYTIYWGIAMCLYYHYVTGTRFWGDSQYFPDTLHQYTIHLNWSVHPTIAVSVSSSKQLIPSAYRYRSAYDHVQHIVTSRHNSCTLCDCVLCTVSRDSECPVTSSLTCCDSDMWPVCWRQLSVQSVDIFAD